MEQCPVCMRMFASSRYLMSHLHQSTCQSAILHSNLGREATNISTLHDTGSTSNEDLSPPLPSSDTIQRPISTNAFGDIIFTENDDDSQSFPVFDEMDDTDYQLDTILPTEPTGDALANIYTGEQGTPAATTAGIFTINENESFNVPFDSSNDKLIPILKMVAAVRASGAPLSLLDTLVKIIKDEWQVGRLDITHLCTHKTAMRRITKLFPSLPCPMSVTVTHERTIAEINNGAQRHSVTFPKFSFLGQFQDLLDDHIFSDLQNLVVDPNNRWEYYVRNSCPHSSNEIQDGEWFQGIIKTLQANSSSNDSADGTPVKDFLFGIQGYTDKTGTDAYQRTSVEPLVFTLTLFTNENRNSDKNWRVLALLPASLCQKQRKKHSFGASVRNYHIALKEALSEFIECQKNPPIVRLRLGDQYQYVRAHFYWVNTIADGLANEALTGRIMNRHSSPRLSRGCHCPQHLADESTLTCNFPRQAAIERVTVAALGPLFDNSPGWDAYINSLANTKERKSAESALKTRKKIAEAILHNVFGQHVVDLVWFHVNQGPDPRGCFGSTPVDPMHAFEEGIVPNIMSVILDPLSESVKSSLDALAINIVSCNRWDPDYPRMNFSGGFSSLTQLTADEKIGKMLLLLIIARTTLGQEIMEKRCNATFDEQRVARASRFSFHDDESSHMEDADDIREDEDEDDIEVDRGTSRSYMGTDAQIELVNQCLRDHGLQYIIPWISEMMPYHQEVLRRHVFRIRSSKGKALRHVLPEESFLDRRVVDNSAQSLYVTSDGHGSTGTNVEGTRTRTTEARYSIDSTAAGLVTLLEMLLAFHASYKYGLQEEMVNFDANVRLMMKTIKEKINRGNDTKNWSISKFHELLHMQTDMRNFGSHANVDAGKGEHGLKRWAKLPSKTVRTRDARHYYLDMATRIKENRLIEVATATLLPRTAYASLQSPADHDNDLNDDESNVTIKLTNPLMTLEVIGPSLLPPELTAYLRSRPNVVFPIQVYQEATYLGTDGRVTTIRGTPNYRNSGPWYDCVMVAYEDDRDGKREYPFQIYAMFTENGKVTKSAIGKMGLQKIRTSGRLMDEWTYEKQYRIVDLETTSRFVFALSIPASCFKEDGAQTPHRLYVLRDRISEWPGIFNDSNWFEAERVDSTRKRKRRR